MCLTRYCVTRSERLYSFRVVGFMSLVYPKPHYFYLRTTLEAWSKDDEYAASFRGILSPIANDVVPLLEFIRHSFPGYPSHGVDHSIRILERMKTCSSCTGRRPVASNTTRPAYSSRMWIAGNRGFDHHFCTASAWCKAASAINCRPLTAELFKIK